MASASSSVTSDLLDRALAQHEDQAGHPLVDRRRGRPGGCGRRAAWPAWRGPAERVSPARVVAARRNQCSLANSTWPNWWRIISCSTGGQRDRVDDRLDVEAVAGVGRDATGARVRVGQQPGRLELGEDVADGRAGHAEAVALDERLAADRLWRS